MYNLTTVGKNIVEKSLEKLNYENIFIDERQTGLFSLKVLIPNNSENDYTHVGYADSELQARKFYNVFRCGIFVIEKEDIRQLKFE
jgi:hypothetical protein